MANLEVKFPISRDAIAAVYLAQSMGLDVCSALYLYDKYREDFFFLFYMLGGKKLQFPDVDMLVKSRKASDMLYRNVTTDSYKNPDLVRDKDALAFIYSHLSEDGESITFNYTERGEVVRQPDLVNEIVNEAAEILSEG